MPQKKGRQTRLQQLSDEGRTMVFYESPHRVVKALQQFIEVFGPERPVAVCREISKVHEEFVRGTLSEALAHFSAHEPRGEFVIVVAGKDEKEKTPAEAVENIGSLDTNINSNRQKKSKRNEL